MFERSLASASPECAGRLGGAAPKVDQKAANAAFLLWQVYQGIIFPAKPMPQVGPADILADFCMRLNCELTLHRQKGPAAGSCLFDNYLLANPLAQLRYV